MSTGIMYYERPIIAGRRRTPGGLPGAAVRAGRLLELWGYRAARPARRERVVQASVQGVVDFRVGGASSVMTSRPRIY